MMARAQHLALGLLLLAASAAAVSAKHPLLSDRLTGAPARAASVQPASYDDKSKRACFAETEACGVWGKDELNDYVQRGPGTDYYRYEAGWTSTLTCSDCHSGSSYYENEGPLFDPSASPAGWCYFGVSSYDNVPVPGGAHGDLVVDGFFNAACYFGEGGKGSCLPDECSETELVVSAPFFQSDKMLFSVDPNTATEPGRCPQDDRRRLAANNEDAAAKTDPAAKAAPKAARAETANVPGGTPTTYYEGRGNVYAGAATLYSRNGPFKGQPKSVWFQYAWASTRRSYRPITNAGGRTVYTPWSYTIDFPLAADGKGGKDEYERY